MRRAGLLLLLLLLAACQRPEVADKAGHPVLAKVNGAEITAGDAASPQGLESVIDRELLVQKALEARLDQDPLVAQSLEAARRQILAQAWLERRAAGTAAARPDEIRAFYADNPALFGERRIYRLRELAVAGAADLVDALRREVLGVQDLDEIATWLRTRNVAYRPAASVQPAEQVPLSHLPRMARMKPGDIAVLETPAGATVTQLVDMQEAPLSEREATPMIESFLSGRKRLEMAAAEVKRLREVARIEYVGELKTR